MSAYQINFLGPPAVLPPEAKIELRSKKTWAVLASLMLPVPLTARSLPVPVLRQTLAAQLWDCQWDCDKSTDPRTHLRQCVQSLQKSFPDSILADRNTLQVVPGRFVSDIELMLTAYEQARMGSSLEERLYWLTEAEEMIGGEFLEGCISEADYAYNWWLGGRDEAQRKVTMVRLALAAALKEAQNDNAAFDIVGKVFQVQPDHQAARALFWELAVKTGQEQAFHALEAAATLEEAVSSLGEKSADSLTVSGKRTFAGLVETEICALSEAAGQAFRRLCVFPNPFSAKRAKQVCGVSLDLLKTLAATSLLQRCGKEYQIHAVVRNCAWRKLPASARRQLTKQLALFCVEAMTTYTPPENVLPAPLGSAETEMALLRLTLDWILEQSPIRSYVSFINMLRYCGVHDLAQQGLPYLQRAYADPLLPAEVRLFAALFASYIFMHVGDNLSAISALESALPFVASVPVFSDGRYSEISWQATIYTGLMMCYSNVEEWEKAKCHAQEALKFSRLGSQSVENLDQGAVHCLRFLAEIHHHTGEWEQALTLCEQALALRRVKQFPADDLPDALYWKARILYGLRRLEEAADAVEEALTLWQQAGDTKTGLCIRLMGQIRAAQGRFAEASAHVHHALWLHERAGREMHRMETREVLGDILAATNQAAEARPHYQECLRYYDQECLRYYETQRRLQRAQRVQQKLTLLL